MTVKRHLVIVRAGSRSLHRGWLAGDATWDLAISSYDSAVPEDFPEARYFHFYKGGKWGGIAAFFAAHPECLERYDTLWLPDDDIEANCASINDAFSALEEFGFGVMQPSLERESYFWHPITLHCPLTQVRFTNFVEVMVPFLKTSLARDLLPVFARSRSGWGIDWLWADAARNQGLRSGILDRVQVRHTRPVGSALAKEMKQQGLSGVNELQATGYENARALCHEAVLINGWRLRGQSMCGFVQFVAHAPWASRGRHKRSGLRVFFGSLYSHIMRRRRTKRLFV